MLDHAARTHLAYVVCRLLSHAILNTRISCSSLSGSEPWRLDASSAQARPRFDRSAACATLFGAVQKKQADDHMSAHREEGKCGEDKIAKRKQSSVTSEISLTT